MNRQCRRHQTGHGGVNPGHDLIEHPQLRKRRMPVHSRAVEVTALAWGTERDGDAYPVAPALDAHGAALRAAFA